MVLAISRTEADREARTNAETAFKRLAEVFGKQTLPWETVKGRAVPNVGAWTLDYDPSTDTYIIREIVDKTGRDKTPFGVFRLPPDSFIVAVDMVIRAINLYKSLYPTLPKIIPWASVTLPGVRRELPRVPL